MRQGWVLVLGSVFCLLSCGRNTQMLYTYAEQPHTSYSGTHSLKSLQGQRKVDILWVIDNSPSMGPHQRSLINNCDTFINDFVSRGGLEWKMGLLSTDRSDPPVIGFPGTGDLNYQMPDAVGVFQAAVGRLGTGGSGEEMGFLPIKQALTAYPDFLRAEATLAVIFISDAPDQSKMGASEIVDQVRKLKKQGGKLIAYGAFGAQDLGCDPTDERWDFHGSAYGDLVEATHGKAYPLCADFGKSLADLGKDLVTRLEQPYITLEDRPIISSLRVLYQGRELPGGSLESGGHWIYDFDTNRVNFHNLAFAPGDNEEVQLEYETVVSH